MTATYRLIGRGAGAIALVLGCLAVSAPFLNADRFREPLKTSLEAALRRQVRMGEIRYRMFPAPGLTAANVVIAEDPEYGLDALAYVDELGVEFRWSALVRGRMEVAAVRLIDASVNLARNEAGEWALRKALTDSLGDRSSHPRFLIQNGRINFRTGTMKSPFYLNDVELELDASSDGGVEWRYEASPARTDRAEQGFGRFTGDGRWHPDAKGGTVDIALSLERSSTAEVSMLLTSRDIGIPGRVWSQARLFGPLASIKIAGALQFEGLERAGFLPFQDNRLSIPYEGWVDLPGQRLQLSTQQTKDKNLPISAEFRVEEFLGSLTREVVFRLDRMPAESLLEISRRLGQTAHEGLEVEGEINGTISAGDSGVGGEIEISEPRLRIRDLPAIEAERAQVKIANDELRLSPVLVTADDIAAQLEGAWRTTDGALRFSGRVTNLPLAGVRTAARQLVGARHFPPQPFGRSGRISGEIRYDSTQAEEPWSGDFTLVGGEMEAGGIPQTIAIRKADVRIRGEQWALRGIQGAAGAVAFTGEYSHTPGAKRPHRLAIRIQRADAREIEELLAPALQRDRGLLERALRFRSELPPGWLRGRRVEARVTIDNLAAGSHEFRSVRSTLFWDGTIAQSPDLTAQWSGANFRGYFRADLSSPSPKYMLKGQLEGLAFLGGSVDFDLEARGDGPGAGLLSGASGSADFQARNVQAGDELLRQVSGTVELVSDRSGTRARIRPLEVWNGSDVLVGHGTISAEGFLTAEVANSRRSLRLALDLDEPGGNGR